MDERFPTAITYVINQHAELSVHSRVDTFNIFELSVPPSNDARRIPCSSALSDLVEHVFVSKLCSDYFTCTNEDIGKDFRDYLFSKL